MKYFFILLYLFFLTGCLCQKCSKATLNKGFMSNATVSKFAHKKVDCPKTYQGYPVTPLAGNCLFKLNKKDDFYSLVKLCSDLRAKLVEPREKNIYGKVCKAFAAETFFIGAQLTSFTDNKYHFHWSSNSDNATKDLEAKWLNDGPSHQGKKRCVGVKACGHKEVDCTEKMPSGCQIQGKKCNNLAGPDAALVQMIDGFCYSFYTKDQKTWLEAEATCRSHFGFLAELESDNVRKALIAAAKKIHLKDEVFHVGGYKINGENTIRFSYSGHSVPTSKFKFVVKPKKNEAKVFAFTLKNTFLKEEGNTEKPFICQNSRHNPCTKGVYSLGGCYTLSDKRFTFNDCLSHCKSLSAKMPEPRTKVQWEGAKLALKLSNANADKAFLGIIAKKGKVYFDSEYKAGSAHYIDCLECPHVIFSGSMVDSVLLLNYNETENGYSIYFTKKNTKEKCLCKTECPRDGSRCYASNFDYENNKCNECPQDHYGADCTIKCSWEICDMHGHRMQKCSLGKYGKKCDQVCSSKCKDISTCSVVTGSCLGCTEGYRGFQCNERCKLCKKCDDQGKCLEGCVPGRYGDKCEKKCAANCANGNCDIKTGNCNECKKGFYGKKCDKTCTGECDQSGVVVNACGVGTFGASCANSCNSSCLNSECTTILGTCNGCVEGFYGLYCERRCTSCNNCDRYGDCKFDCVIGYYGQYCEHTCSTKCKNQNCDKDGYCRECEDGFYGDFCTSECPHAMCDKHGNSLTKCFPGLYGEMCDKVCSANCVDGICSQLTGTCESCKPGYYGAKCETRCALCDTCLRNGLCVGGCPTGKYGIDCEDKCKDECLNGICDMATGKCMECPFGKYGADCTNDCSNAAFCSKDTGADITPCAIGKFGANCAKDCPSTCRGQACAYLTGNCMSCEQGMFGLKCEKKCDTCVLGCDVTGLCIKSRREIDYGAATVNFTCALGFFGPKCLYKCKRCLAGNCDHMGKCLACADGFYGEDCTRKCPNGNCNMTGVDSQACTGNKYGPNCAKDCSLNCESTCIKAFGGCHKCKEGYYGRFCENKCKKCTKCDRYGDCTEECPKGSYGKKCELKCNKVCDFGECKLETGECSYCKKGQYGLLCEKKCGHCAGQCKESMCQGNCSFGYYGDRCDRMCPARCFHGDCEKDGKCKECRQGYYGPSCNKLCVYDACDAMGKEIPKCKETMHGRGCMQNCSSTCLNRKCHQVTGNCIECIAGFYGPMCENTCSKCLVCDMTEKCLSECSPGVYGDKCDKECKGDCRNSHCNKSNGICFECPLDSYGVNCEMACGNTTQQCISRTECEVGLFGQNCDKPCSRRCLNNKCSKLKGTCDACPRELNLFGVSCELQCGNCLEGCDNTGMCNPPPQIVTDAGDLVPDSSNLCEIGFYGPSCKLMCSEDCLRRDCKIDGECKACPPGRHSLNCLSKCSTQNCDMTGNNLEDCPLGFYGENCNEKCSPACADQICTSNGLCVNCIKGYYGFDCSQTCMGCDECDELGKCISACHYGLFGPKCQFKCSQDCHAHNCEPSSGICLECPNGFYGEDCSQSCMNNAFKCDMNGYQQHLCEEDKFGRDCSQTCPDTCNSESCSDAGSCDSCSQGFYGTMCEKECGQCTSCNRGGTCMSTIRFDAVTKKDIVVPRCAHGLTGPKCQRECSANCVAFNCDDNGKCRECLDGYYGDECDQTCEGICDINGTIIAQKCEDGTYGPSCEFDCSENCLQNLCMMQTGTCLECPKHKFGQFCERNCYGTQNCDRTGRAQSKCYPGLFGERCDKKCSSNCLHGNCDEDGFCLECPKGFFGADCQSICNSTVCHVETGEDMEDCSPGSYGKGCKGRCSSKCEGNLCSTIEGTCESCVEGYFGLECELMCSNCKECDSKGVCLSACFPGHTGKMCDKSCPDNCYAKACNVSGVCIECAIGLYGKSCTDMCPNDELCNDQGEPEEECPTNYFGFNCSESCASSCMKGCSHNMGICNECKYGTYGLYCEIKCTSRCGSGCNRQGLCNPERVLLPASSNAVLMASIIGLVVFLLVLGVIAAKFAMGKDLARGTSKTEAGESHTNIMPSDFLAMNSLIHTVARGESVLDREITLRHSFEHGPVKETSID